MLTPATYVVLWLCVSCISIPSASGQGNGAVTLYRNGLTSIYYSSGIVRVYYNGEWGNICNSSFSLAGATVVCHQLSYTGATSYSYSGIEPSFGIDPSYSVLSDVNCSSSYLTILQCSYSTYFDSSCKQNYNDVIVTCYTTRIWDNPYYGQIRLNGSDFVTEGLVEVYCSKYWGTICVDYDFSSKVVHTVCNQLGYNDFVTYGIAKHGGVGFIWLTDAHCDQIHFCLSTCTSCPSNSVSGCDHDDDLVVQCQYLTTSSTFGATLHTCDSATDDSDDSNTALILGLIIGIPLGLYFCCYICICCCYCCSKLKEKAENAEYNMKHDELYDEVTTPPFTI